MLRKAQELASGSEVSVFHSSGGGESPAGTAVSLVLDGVDTTLGSPVPSTISRGGEVLDVLLRGGTTSVTEESLQLSLGPGGEHVVTDGESVLGVSIDALKGQILLNKELESVFVLLFGSVRDTVVLEMSVEGIFEGKDLIEELDLRSEEFGKEVHLKK